MLKISRKKLKQKNSLLVGAGLVYIFGCSLGVLIAFYPTLLSGFAFLQTDPGDTRLNNYFLEHSFQMLVNRNYIGGLWSPSFFYPYKQVLAFSDNLFGSAPVYWLFRSFLSSDIAFQLWMISVCILNFASFAVLMRKHQVSHVLSVLGAFLFAFSMPRIAQIVHQQLLPQFFTPLVFLTVWNFVKQPSRKQLTLLLLLTYLQLLAGFYLGWFLLFSLPLFFGIAYILDLEARTSFLAYWRGDRRAIVAIALAWVALVISTLFPYLESRLALGSRLYSEVDTMLPRIGSWFSVPPGSVWSPLLEWTSKDLPVVHEHYMFAGFTVILLTILSIYAVFLKKNVLTPERALVVKVCLLVFVTIFCLSLRLPSGLSLWRIVYEVVPGASAIRAVTRIWTISYFYLLVAVILCLDSLLRTAVTTRSRLVIVTVLCVISVSEQIVFNLPSYNKAIFTKEVTELRELIKKDCDIAYISLKPENPFYVDQLSAMWAGIEANVPVINGYSGSAPLNYPESMLSSMSPFQAVSWLGKGINKKLCIVFPRGQEETENYALSSLGAKVSKSSENFSSFEIQLPITDKFGQEIHSYELPPNIKVEKVVEIPVIVKNKSNFVWKTKGVNPVRFSYHWLDSNNKLLVFDGERTDLPENVVPQSSVALNASIKLPVQPGEYLLLPSMVQEGVSWFDSVDNSQPLKIPVTVPLDVGKNLFGQKIQLLKPLKVGKVDKEIKVPVSVQNTSNFVWDSTSANSVNFSYNWFDFKGNRVVLDGERTALPKSLAPHDSVKLNAVIKFPKRPGKYTLILSMVQEGVAWFNDQGAQAPKIPVTITSQ